MTVGAQRIYHVNVNCSDLDRSLVYYRDLFGLTPTVRTTPDRQPGTGFGLEVAQWDAWIMAGDRGVDGVVLDLLEWKVPAPTASRPASMRSRGFSRLGLRHRDLDSLHAALADGGHPAATPPTEVEVGDHVMRMLHAHDPDGTLLQVIEGDTTEPSHVTIGCTDLERSLRVHTDVMGLRLSTRRWASGPLDAEVAWCRCPVTGFGVELVAWSGGPEGPGGRAANELEIFRMAWITDDVERDHSVLTEAGIECYSPPVELDMNLGEHSVLRALFFDDPDGACLELIEPPDVSSPR